MRFIWYLEHNVTHRVPQSVRKVTPVQLDSYARTPVQLDQTKVVELRQMSLAT